MSTPVTFNGVSYTVPAIADASWGTNVSNYLIAISTGCLQKTGGTFTLSTADVDFGATYGLKSVYFKSKSSNIASAGVVVLANQDAISWRNAANAGDKSLTVNSSDVLTFDGAPIVTLALGAANTVLRMNSGGTAYEFATIQNVNVNAAAAIAGTKISPIFGAQAITTTSNLGVGTASPTAGIGAHIALNASSGHLQLQRTGSSTGSVFVGSAGGDFRVGTTDSAADMFYVLSNGSAALPALNVAGIVHNSSGGVLTTSLIVNADVSASAAIVYSKLSLTGGIVNADVNASAAIAYSKLALTGGIINADVNAAAAIVYSKLSLSNSIVNADINSAAAIAYSKLSLTGGIINADVNAAAAITYSKLNLTGGIVNADVNAAAGIAYTKLTLTASIVNTDVKGTAAIAYSKLNLTGLVVNADISTSAGIIYTKLALSNSIVNADIKSNAGIAYTKLNLGTSIVNSDISGAAAIAYSKLSLSNSIVDADINNSAAIARSKLAAGTADHVVINATVTGAFSSEAQLAITRGGTGQATANAALNALLPSQTSNSGKQLQTDGTNTSWVSPLSTTLTSAHLFIGNGSNVATDTAVTGDITITNAGVTAIGSGKVTSAMIVDGTIVNADVNASAAIAGTKIAPDFGSQNVQTTGKAGVGAAVDATAQLYVTQSASSAQIKLERTTSSTGVVWLGTAGGDARFGTTAGASDICSLVSTGSTFPGGFLGSTSGSVVASGKIGEVTEFVYAGGTAATTTANTAIDVQSITVPAGTWLIDVDYTLSLESQIALGTANLSGQLQLTDNSNVLLSRSLTSFGGVGVAKANGYHVHIRSSVALSGSATYKTRLICDQATANGAAKIYNDGTTYAGAGSLTVARISILRIA